MTPDTNYDRLIIIGEIETRKCFAIIADSAQRSSLLFADRKLTIGAIVDVKEAIFSNSRLGNDPTNPIFSSVRGIYRRPANGAYSYRFESLDGCNDTLLSPTSTTFVFARNSCVSDLFRFFVRQKK